MNTITAPIAGDLGSEEETVEIIPTEEPLSVPVPEPETAPVEPEPVPA